MAEIFEPITLSWKGEEYTIPADRVMEVICRIEDVVTLSDMANAQARGSMPMGKVSKAYASVLRYAGARNASDSEVYAGMFDKTEDSQRMVTAINTLLMMMVPPSAIKDDGEPGPFGNQQDSNSKSTTTPAKASGSASKKGSSSSKRSKRG